MDYRGGDEFVKLQTASEENSMTGRAYNTEVEEKNILTLAENEAKKKKKLKQSLQLPIHLDPQNQK